MQSEQTNPVMKSWSFNDTQCREWGLALYGAGMHYDPLISSRSKLLVSWGRDWVVLCLASHRLSRSNPLSQSALLDRLRERDDFQRLTTDLVFPASPFAQDQ